MMGEILLHWIEKKLGLYLPHISDDARFRRSVSNCHLIGEILRKYNIISDDQCIALHKDLSTRSSAENIKNLFRWLASSGFGVAYEDLLSVVEGTPGAAIKFLYRLYLWLEVPKEYPLHVQKKSKCTNRDNTDKKRSVFPGNSLQPEDRKTSTSELYSTDSVEQNEVSMCLPFQVPVLLNVTPYLHEKISDAYSCESCFNNPNLVPCEAKNSVRGTSYTSGSKETRGNVREELQEMMEYDKKASGEFAGTPFVDNLTADAAKFYMGDDKKLQFEQIYTATQLRLACSLAHRFQEEIVSRVFLNASREATIVNLMNMSHELKKKLTNHMKEASAKAIQEVENMYDAEAVFKQYNVESCLLAMERKKSAEKAANTALYGKEAESHEMTTLSTVNQLLSDLLDIVVEVGTLRELGDEYPDTSLMIHNKVLDSHRRVSSMKEGKEVSCGAAVVSLSDTAAVHAYIFRKRSLGGKRLDGSMSERSFYEDSSKLGLEKVVGELLNEVYPSQAEVEERRIPEVRGIVTLSGLSMQWEVNKVQDAVMQVIGNELRIIDAAKVVELAIAAFCASQREQEEPVTFFNEGRITGEEEMEGEFEVLWPQVTRKAVFQENQKVNSGLNGRLRIDGPPDGVRLHPTRQSGQSGGPTRSLSKGQAYLTEKGLHEAMKTSYANEVEVVENSEEDVGVLSTAGFRDASTLDELQLLFSPDDVPESWPHFVSLGKEALTEMLEYGIVPPDLVAQVIVERMCHYPPEAFVLILNYPNGISEALALEGLLQGRMFNGFEESVYADTIFDDTGPGIKGGSKSKGPEDLLRKPGLNLFQRSSQEQKEKKNCFKSSLQGVIIAEERGKDGIALGGFPSGAENFEAIVKHSQKKLQELYSYAGLVFNLPYEATTDCYENLEKIFLQIGKATESIGEQENSVNTIAKFGGEYSFNGIHLCAESSGIASSSEPQDDEAVRQKSKSEGSNDSATDERAVGAAMEPVEGAPPSFFAGLNAEFLKEVSDFWITMERCYVEGIYGIMGGFREHSERLTRHLVQSKDFYSNILEKMSGWDQVLNRFMCEFNSIEQLVRWDPEVKAHLHKRILELKLRAQAYCIEHYGQAMQGVDLIQNDPVYEKELCYVVHLYSSMIHHEVDRYNDTMSFLCDVMQGKQINVPLIRKLSYGSEFDFTTMMRSSFNVEKIGRDGGTRAYSPIPLHRVSTSMQAQVSTVRANSYREGKQKSLGRTQSAFPSNEEGKGSNLWKSSKFDRISTLVVQGSTTNSDDMTGFQNICSEMGDMGECSLKATQFLTEMCEKILQDLGTIESVLSQLNPKIKGPPRPSPRMDITSENIRSSGKTSARKETSDGTDGIGKGSKRRSPKKRGRSKKSGRGSPGKKKSPKKKSKRKKKRKEEHKVEHVGSDRSNGYPAVLTESPVRGSSYHDERNPEVIFLQCAMEEGHRLLQQITFVQKESIAHVEKIFKASVRLHEAILKNAADVLRSQLERIETVCNSWEALVEIGSSIQQEY